MPNWKELGEIPDSEEEDGGFESQDLGSGPVQTPTNAYTDHEKHDVWDVPDSPIEEQLQLPTIPSSKERPPVNIHATTNELDSSPLSSLASDQDLPSIDQLVIAQRDSNTLDAEEPKKTSTSLRAHEEDEGQSTASLRTPTTKLSSQGRQVHGRTFSHVTSPRAPAFMPPANENTADLEARQVAVRQERSLRPRKPIQEHPYLLENAHYSTFLREHGVKPVRLIVEAERQRRQDTPVDEEFVDESQNLGLPDVFEDSQSKRTGDEDSQDQEPANKHTSRGYLHVALSSSPPKTSPLNDGAASSSRATSPGGTDNTSFLDHDLPDIDELLTLPPRSKARLGRQREASPIESSIRKRRKHDATDENDPNQRTMNRGVSNFSDPLVTPPRLVLRKPSPSPIVPKATRSPSTRWQSPELPVPKAHIIESDSEEHSIGEQQNELMAEDEDEESESSSEVESALARRLRRVLPASWLRLDQQSGRDKVQRDVSKRQRDRPLEQEQRRGLAQRRHVNTTQSTHPVFLDDSEDEDESQLRRVSKDDFQLQTQLVLQPLHNLNPPQEIDSEDGSSIMEDDHIDLMSSGRKRQLKLSESFQGPRKRIKAVPGVVKRSSRSLLNQPKITGMLQGRSGSQPVAREKIKKPAKNNQGQRPLGKPTRPLKKSIPRAATSVSLSILDVIEPDAPKFLRIAARTAKQRRDQGRSSPRRKRISLATRKDHVDAASSLYDWKTGSIQPRPSVTARAGQSSRAEYRSGTPSLNHSKSANILAKLLSAPRGNARISARHASLRIPTKKPSDRLPSIFSNQQNPKRIIHRVHSGPVRQAQLETDLATSNTSHAFHSRKRHLDRQYQRNQHATSRASTQAASDSGAAVPNSTPPLQTDPSRASGKSNSVLPRKSRPRKATKPRRIDVQAPEYTQAHDPLPTYHVPDVEPPLTDIAQSRLLGLGPYGTHYTHHFEVFPLHRGVYFHDSTLIGQGVIESIHTHDKRPQIAITRPRISFSLGEKTLRWDSWTEQVSSELGIAFDLISEQLERGVDAIDSQGTQPITHAATSILEYVRSSISFVDEAQVRIFIVRLCEVVGNFNQRMTLRSEPNQNQQCGYHLKLQIYDWLLLIVWVAQRMCENSTLLAQEHFQMQELLKASAKIQMSFLVNVEASLIRQSYESLGNTQARERGLREDEPVVHSWVVLLKVFEHARIPRTSFWDLLQATIATPKALATTKAGELERIWERFFSLLPLLEFNDAGVIIPGRRHYVVTDSWALPQRLLKRVFQLYEQNTRQAPSFNNYCRSLVARCHYLVDQWGWRRPIAIIGLIFDFFGTQGLGHLRNEEVYGSPRFLEKLHQNPGLTIEPEDRCFHVFLKLLALSIQKLKDVDAMNDIRNLVTRTLPNHNRQHEKEQNIHERDLAALRNHHDLLCTLFWAAPPDSRPILGLIKGLVDPAASHKEATLINLRAWSQLARFIVATGEGKLSFQPFGEWRDTFFEQILHLFDGVESDIQRQYLSLPKDVIQSINKHMIQAMIATNRKAVLDVLHYSVTASLDVMRLAPDLTTAIAVLNIGQLQQVFKHFTVTPPQLDWGILRQCLTSLEFFLSKIDEFMDAESQQSESLFMQHSEADDALGLLDNHIAKSFFSMARCMLSSRANRTAGALAAMDWEDCMEKVVRLSARFSAKLIRSGFLRPSQLFKSGSYGLFDNVPPKLDVDQRKLVVLFMATMLKHGFDDFNDAGFTLMEFWALSIIKPRNLLRYEYQFAEQLRLRNKDFVPDAIVGLAIQPDYSSNRDLFKYMISAMRSSASSAGPSLKKILNAEHSKVLKMVMDQLKGDLKLAAQQGSAHHEYVLFVRDVIADIRALGSEICTVDDYFYHISKEYSPPAQDPQLQVPAMIAYGLRIEEGETRAAHQLFFFLLSNFKASMINDGLGEQCHMLRRAMKDPRILRFILGQMLPAIIRSCAMESRAYALIDVYVEALRLLFSENVAAHELVEDDLPHLAVTIAVAVEMMEKLRQKNELLSEELIHTISQVFAAINLTWPSVLALGLSHPDTPRWTHITKCLKSMNTLAISVEARLDDLRGRADRMIGASQLFGDVDVSGPGWLHVSSLVVEFTENIVHDIQGSWVVVGDKLSMQAPGSARGLSSTQPSKGVKWPELQMDLLLLEFRGRVLELRSWCDRAYGSSGTQTRRTKQNGSILF